MELIIRRMAATALMPLPVCLLLGFAGWILWSRGQRTKAGQTLVALSLVLLTVLGLPPVGSALAGMLEHGLVPFPGGPVDYVVVLGSGHVSDPELPVSSRLSEAGLYRLVEGLRIAQAQPQSTLVLSGYGGADPRPNAEVYRDVAISLGFPVARIVTEGRPHTTAEEAELLEPLLRGHRFALVTSATHMPRAVALFRARDLVPVPAPTGYLSARVPGMRVLDFVPEANALERAQRAWYEVLSRLWAHLRGDL